MLNEDQKIARQVDFIVQLDNFIAKTSTMPIFHGKTQATRHLIAIRNLAVFETAVGEYGIPM